MASSFLWKFSRGQALANHGAGFLRDNVFSAHGVGHISAVRGARGRRRRILRDARSTPPATAPPSQGFEIAYQHAARGLAMVLGRHLGSGGAEE